MKKVVLFALIAALAAGALLYFYLGKLEQKTEVKVVYEDVLVAAADIPAYSSVTAEMVTVKQVPQGTSHPLAARTPEEVVGFVTENPIVAGEEILPVKLKQPGQTESGLSYIVPEGMLAVTVAVDEVSGVAGFLQRGDYVDVIAYTTTSCLAEGQTVPADATTVPTQATTLVAAQNVCVAAVGTTLKANAAADDAPAELYASVTLFLTPEDALRVIQSAKSGVIILALRGSSDHTPNTEDPIVSDTLLNQAD